MQLLYNQIMQLIIVYSRVILHMNYILITSITCSISRSLYEVATLYREEIILLEQKFTAILREGRALAFNSNTLVFNTYHTNAATPMLQQYSQLPRSSKIWYAASISQEWSLHNVFKLHAILDGLNTRSLLNTFLAMPFTPKRNS